MHKAVRAVVAVAFLAGASGRGAQGQPGAAVLVTATLQADRPGPTLDRNLQGQFAEHLGTGVYGGLWVGPDSPIPNTRGFRTDVVAALRRIRVPVVRWPGGCFADDYDWRDGIGPRDRRPVRLNSLWGGVEEPNTVGTHEYMDLMAQLGAKSYVSANVGSGSPRAMAQWIEYMTSPSHSALAEERRRNGHDAPFPLDVLGIGNESWGCGGAMRPEHYADLLRQYAVFVRPGGGQRVVRVASGADREDYRWTETVMTNLSPPGLSGYRLFDALSLHYYTFPGGSYLKKGPATGFGEAQWMAVVSQALRLDGIIAQHSAIMDKYDPEKRVALFVDEWGTWYDPTPGTNPGFLRQENTLRDAVVAAASLLILQQHADRVRMANIAQMVNVLQAMVLTDGPRLVLTPTYHTFDLFQVFQGATFLPLEVRAPAYRLDSLRVPAVVGGAGRGTDGLTYVGLVNLDPRRTASLRVAVAGMRPATVSGRVLTAAAMDARNSVQQPDVVRPAAFTGARLEGQTLVVTLPAKSVVVLSLR
ncbi:MAG TPA: alpha-L-arabinofuranosidase C-terminal domain-containing protein [Gemmatirosa sp.]